MKKNIGICVANFQDVGTYQIVRAVSDCAEKQGFRVLIYGCFSKVDVSNAFGIGEASIFHSIPIQDLSGLVIMAQTISNEEILAYLKQIAMQRKIPIVSIDYPMEECFNVRLNYEDTFKDIVRHVIEMHKCRNPFFMAGYKGNEFSEKRIEKFREVLKENDLPVIEEHIAYGDFWEMPSRNACEKWMQNREDLPDAIICANDMMALSVIEVLKRHNMKVPEEVIVTGFDGFELESYCTPRLTTAQINLEDIARHTIQMIQDKLAHPDILPYTECVSFNARYTESCGCRAVQYMNTNRIIMDVYGKMSGDRQHINDMFDMMTHLTESYSMRTMLEGLNESILYSIHWNLMIFVSRDFFDHTDIQPPEQMEPTDLITLVKSKDGTCTNPLQHLHCQDISKELIDFMAEEDRILFLPLHWQGEIYGCVALTYHNDTIDYEWLNDFILSMAQIFATVRRQAQLHDMYIRDAMTTLYNQRGFYSVLKTRMQASPVAKKQIFMASVDLDRLKYINDNFGHAEGDVAIKAIGLLLKQAMGRNSICARFGGDEFVGVCLLAQETEIDYEKDFRERFQQLLVDWNAEQKKPYLLGASYGLIRGEIETVDQVDVLMRESDQKMYRCKVRHHSTRRSRRND